MVGLDVGRAAGTSSSIVISTRTPVSSISTASTVPTPMPMTSRRRAGRGRRPRRSGGQVVAVAVAPPSRPARAEPSTGRAHTTGAGSDAARAHWPTRREQRAPARPRSWSPMTTRPSTATSKPPWGCRCRRAARTAGRRTPRRRVDRSRVAVDAVEEDVGVGAGGRRWRPGAAVMVSDSCTDRVAAGAEDGRQLVAPLRERLEQHAGGVDELHELVVAGGQGVG